MELLESQGFRYRNCVDILDAGPSIEAVVSEVKTVRNSLMATVAIDETVVGAGGEKWLVANPALDHFSCTEVHLAKGFKMQKGDAFRLGSRQARNLNVDAGDQVLVSRLLGRGIQE
jgi:arginine N-succinyltransferase